MRPVLAVLLVAHGSVGCMEGGGAGGGGGGDGEGDAQVEVDAAPGTAFDELDPARAQARFPDTTALMRYVIAPGCAAERNECHNNEDYPDLSSEGNLWNLAELPCNVAVGERKTIEDFCERTADELRITAGANAGFSAKIGWITTVSNAQGAFQHYELSLDKPVVGAQTGAGFEILRGGAVLRALGGGSTLVATAGAKLVRITRAADLPAPAEILQGDENQNGVFGGGQGVLLAAGRARDSYLVRRLLGLESARIRMPLTTNADTQDEANRRLSPDEMYAIMSWINCLLPTDGPYAPIRYDCAANAGNRGAW